MKGQLAIFFTLVIFSSFAQIKKRHIKEFEVSTGKKPVLSLQTFYDKQGNITKIIQKTLDQYGEYFTVTSAYEFDSFGKTTRLVLTQIQKGFPELKTFYKYAHTPSGFEEIGENGKKVIVLNKNKLPLREEYYDNADGLESETEYQYDSKNRLIKKEKRQIGRKDNYLLLTYSYNDSVNQRIEHVEYTTLDSVKTVKDYLTDLIKNKPAKTVCLTDGATETFMYDEFWNEIEEKGFDQEGKQIWHRITKYRYW